MRQVCRRRSRRRRSRRGTHRCGEEEAQVLAAGQERVLGHPGQEALQGPPPGLDEVGAEALHQALHHKLLWQRLRAKQRSPRTPALTPAPWVEGAAPVPLV